MLNDSDETKFKNVPRKNGRIVTNIAEIFSSTDASVCHPSPFYTKDNLIHSPLLENNFIAYHFRLDSADIFRISCDKSIAFVLRTALIMARIASASKV